MRVIILSINKGLYYNTIRCLDDCRIINNITVGTSNIKFSKYLHKCEKFIEVENDDFKLQNEKIINIIRDISSDGISNIIIPSCITSTLYVSYNKEKINKYAHVIPISSYESLKKLNNKWSFYKLLRNCRIPTPNTNIYEYENVIPSVNFPVIIKPTNCSGGYGVCYASGKDELLEKLKISKFRPLIIQDYIYGYEIGISVLCVNGEIKTWTIQKKIFAYNVLEFIENKEVLNYAEKIIKETNYSGLAHIDMRFDQENNTIKVIEFNPRVWGSMGASCYAGVNFIKNAIDIAYDNTISLSNININNVFVFKKYFLKQIYKTIFNFSYLKKMVKWDIDFFLRNFIYCMKFYLFKK